MKIYFVTLYEQLEKAVDFECLQNESAALTHKHKPGATV